MGPREATSGLRGINKWKLGEQQVDGNATGGNGNNATSR